MENLEEQKIVENNSQKYLLDKIGDEHSYRPKKGITKKILEIGYGNLLPKRPSIVKISYKAYCLPSKEIFDEITESDPIKIQLGEDKILPEGAIVGIENMKKGEFAEIFMKKKYGFKDEIGIPEKYKKYIGFQLAYRIKLHDAEYLMDLSGDKKLIKKVIKEGILSPKPLGEADELKCIFFLLV